MSKAPAGTPRRTRFIHLPLVALLALATPGASGDLVGTLAPGAAGDGHLWWSVERIAPPVPGRSGAGQSPEHILMHHASVEPAPTERFVMRLAAPPEAIAAEGSRIAMITPAEGGRRRGVLLLGARRNEASGHWFTVPRGAPRVLPPLAEQGSIEAAALVGDALFVLGTVPLDPPMSEDAGRGLLAVGVSGAESAAWRSVEPPPAALGARVHLFNDDGVLGAAWVEDGRMVVARRPAELSERASAWATESFAMGGDAELVGAFALGGRCAVVERVRRPDGSERLLRVGFLRAGRLEPWAQFPEPASPWTLAPFGADAVLLELDERGRAFSRQLATRANAPDERVALEPPGFASGRWMHVPILGAVSVAFALAALMFGSDAYLQSRPGAQQGPARPTGLLGAPLSRRFLAFVIDAVPAFVLAMLLLGGNPLRFLDLPILTPSFDAAWPSGLVALAAWLSASLGDIAAGRSFGKRAMGLVVVARDGGRPSRRRVALRAALSVVPVLSPFVMLLALVNPWRDGPAEMLSGTVVTEEPTAPRAA